MLREKYILNPNVKCLQRKIYTICFSYLPMYCSFHFNDSWFSVLLNYNNNAVFIYIFVRSKRVEILWVIFCLTPSEQFLHWVIVVDLHPVVVLILQAPSNNSSGRHVASLGYTMLIPSQQAFALTPQWETANEIGLDVYTCYWPT